MKTNEVLRGKFQLLVQACILAVLVVSSPPVIAGAQEAEFLCEEFNGVADCKSYCRIRGIEKEIECGETLVDCIEQITLYGHLTTGLQTCEKHFEICMINASASESNCRYSCSIALEAAAIKAAKEGLRQGAEDIAATIQLLRSTEVHLNRKVDEIPQVY